jgi:hypothetical protein
VILAELRASYELYEAVPRGPARVFVLPERVWNKLAQDGDWPERLMPSENGSPRPSRVAGRKWGERLPECLQPREGNWPQQISGVAARRLCKRPGVVSRIIASSEWSDGWWLRELLTKNASEDETDSIHSRIELRLGAPPSVRWQELARMIARARHWYVQDIRAGVCSWT